MTEKLLLELEANLEYLSVAERKIAKLILADPKEFTKYSLTKLSKQANVSQGSVINFSNKFCGGGFPALKLKIASELSEHEPRPFSVVENSDGVCDVFSKVESGILGALRNTLALNDEKTLARAAELILQAKKVEIYGIFRSGAVATDFYYQLLTLGIPASYVSDVLTCAASASILDKNNLVIAVSSSGQTKDILDAVSLAKSNGVPVICLVGNKNSTLAKLSDVVLVAAACGNSVTGKEMEMRFSQLALTDTLCAYLRNKIDTDGEKRYFKLAKILNSHSVND